MNTLIIISNFLLCLITKLNADIVLDPNDPTQESLPCRGAFRNADITPIDVCQYDDSPYKLVCINNELKINYYDESDTKCLSTPISTIDPANSSMYITSYDCLTTTTCSYATLTQYQIIDENECTYNKSNFTTQAIAVNLCVQFWTGISTTCTKNSITKNIYTLGFNCDEAFGPPTSVTVYDNKCQMDLQNDSMVYVELECYDSDYPDLTKLVNKIVILIIVGVVVGIIILICIICAICSCCCGVTCCLFKKAVPVTKNKDFVEFPGNGRTKNTTVADSEV